jgi:hypothetical protein
MVLQNIETAVLDVSEGGGGWNSTDPEWPLNPNTTYVLIIALTSRGDSSESAAFTGIDWVRTSDGGTINPNGPLWVGTHATRVKWNPRVSRCYGTAVAMAIML